MNIHVNLICNIPKLGWKGAQGSLEISYILIGVVVIQLHTFIKFIEVYTE